VSLPQPVRQHVALGRPLWSGHALARALWLALTGGLLTIFALGLPRSLAIAGTLSPETIAGLHRLGLTPGFPAAYLVLLDLVLMLAFSGLATLIFWRRTGDPIVTLAAMVLLLTGALYTAPMYEAPIPPALLAAICALAEMCQVAFVFVFPDGRFVPRWSWLLLLPLVVWRPLIWALVYIPDYLAMTRTGDQYGFLKQDALDIGLLMGCFVLGIAFQVHRYRRHSTPTQRQQTKWLLFGMAAAIMVVGVYTVGINAIGLVQATGAEALLTRLAGRTVRGVALLMVPITLTYSVLRFRLWQIDTLINRALVYGALTATLASVYLSSVVVLQGIFRSLTGQGSNLAIVLSTLASAALFQPLRDRLQAFIDRRFYRRKYNAARMLAAFSVTLRHEVELQRLSDGLLAVVDDTMQPARLSLWLRPLPDDGKRETSKVKRDEYRGPGTE
jgi:hypothetical protein